jgi:SAM-dependent methyltransferase
LTETSSTQRTPASDTSPPGERSPGPGQALLTGWDHADHESYVAGMEHGLARLAEAVAYHDWLFEAARPFLGERVLEVGAGVGTMTARLGDRGAVVALEVEPDYAQQLRARFANDGRVSVLEGDINDPGLVTRIAGRIDSAMSFNVFEHIPDDVGGMRHVCESLPPGGHFVCLVPAFPLLYGPMDRSLHHIRRYRRADLAVTARAAGFDVIETYYLNAPGWFLWLMRGRVLRATDPVGGSRSLRLFDRTIVPLARATEHRLRPPFGQSVVLVARRPLV